MLQAPKNELRVAPPYQPVFRELGIDADEVFRHPQIKIWRKLDDRENGVLDATLANGRHVRWHVKRYQAARGFTLPAEDEVKGHQALVIERIPTAQLVAWGKLLDRRSFVIFEDLAGYEPADKLVERDAVSFEAILGPTADLAARLHEAGLHHQDLYLCHFLIDPGDLAGVRLIDPARVRRLGSVFTRRRFIVKDLAQFWYSTTRLPAVAGEQRERWLERYAGRRKLTAGRVRSLTASIGRKVRRIASHDANIHVRDPSRNVSIPR